MKLSTLTKIFAVIAAILGTLVLGIYLLLMSINLTPYAPILERYLEQWASHNDNYLKLRIDSLSTKEASISDIYFLVPRLIFPLEAQSLTLDWSLPDLPSLNLNLALDGRLYAGGLIGDLKVANFATEFSGQLTLKDLELMEFPLFQALDLDSGKLYLEVNDFLASSRALEKAEGKLQVSSLSRPGNVPLRLPGTMSPLPINIPEIKDAMLSAIFSLSKDEARTTQTEFTSNILSVKGTGKCQIDERTGCKSYSFDGNVDLGQDFPEEFRALLVVASNGKLKTTTQRFSIHASGTQHRQEVSFEDLG